MLCFTGVWIPKRGWLEFFPQILQLPFVEQFFPYEALQTRSIYDQFLLLLFLEIFINLKVGLKIYVWDWLHTKQLWTTTEELSELIKVPSLLVNKEVLDFFEGYSW